VSAFFRQERVVGDAQVRMLPSSNGDGPTRLYRSFVALMIGLSAVAFLGIGTANSHDRSDQSSTRGSKISRIR
jgi:hypothetical protein